MEQILKSRYRIGEKISENPFSVTYKGFYIGTDKPVIIKIYKRGTLNSSLIREMKQKVKDFSLISHPCIAKIIDGDYGWQGFYYVREFIEGQSLQEIMDRGEKIGLEKGLTVADQVLSALEAAHAKRIVHAALKPSNIFIDDKGIVKLADFVVESEVKYSMPQKVIEIMANAKYASPEELEGDPASPASDIFSLGLILYEMVAGRPVFKSGGLAENIIKLKSAAIRLPDSVPPLPRYLMDILQRALARDPILRFKNSSELRQALERKTLPPEPHKNQEYVKIFESSVTQYGGEEIDKESEVLQDVGRVRLRWSKEKHRNWLLAMVVGAMVTVAILYSFLVGR